MKRILFIAILATALILFCSCSVNTSDNSTAKSGKGFVHIQGNTSGVDVFVNGSAQNVKFDKTTHAAMLRLYPGNYQIRVERNGLDIVNEKITVTTAGTTEVVVP